jgi:folylpolyglutamate synthase/dihydrofolate synthase
MNLELSRINKLLLHINNPHLRLPVIHIAGTNGKGSVSAYVDAILCTAGFRTGRYNSPHLLEPRDSIRVNGAATSCQDHKFALGLVRRANTSAAIGATSFELLTASAFWWFDRQKVDVAIVEVGLGGRLDATNVFTSPLIAVFTSIGLDHMEVLGNTVRDIAREKAGIIKKGCQVVIGPQPEREALETLQTCAANIGCSQVRCVKQAQWIPSRPKWAMLRLPEDCVEYPVPLEGDIQLENSATAVTTIDLLRKSETRFSGITTEHIVNGMATVRWPGRLEWVDVSEIVTGSGIVPESDTKVLVDGAHNVPAAKSLRHYVGERLNRSQPVHWVFASKSEKDVYKILGTLLRRNDTLTTVGFSKVEGMPWVVPCDPHALADYASKINDGIRVQAANNLPDALRNAVCNAGKRGGKVVMCGSLYLVADLFRLLKIEL